MNDWRLSDTGPSVVVPAGITYALGGYFVALPYEYLIPIVWIPWLFFVFASSIANLASVRRMRQYREEDRAYQRQMERAAHAERTPGAVAGLHRGDGAVTYEGRHAGGNATHAHG